MSTLNTTILVQYISTLALPLYMLPFNLLSYTTAASIGWGLLLSFTPAVTYLLGYNKYFGRKIEAGAGQLARFDHEPLKSALDALTPAEKNIILDLLPPEIAQTFKVIVNPVLPPRKPPVAGTLIGKTAYACPAEKQSKHIRKIIRQVIAEERNNSRPSIPFLTSKMKKAFSSSQYFITGRQDTPLLLRVEGEETFPAADWRPLGLPADPSPEIKKHAWIAFSNWQAGQIELMGGEIAPALDRARLEITGPDATKIDAAPSPGQVHFVVELLNILPEKVRGTLLIKQIAFLPEDQLKENYADYNVPQQTLRIAHAPDRLDPTLLTVFTLRAIGLALYQSLDVLDPAYRDDLLAAQATILNQGTNIDIGKNYTDQSWSDRFASLWMEDLFFAESFMKFVLLGEEAFIGTDLKTQAIKQNLFSLIGRIFTEDHDAAVEFDALTHFDALIYA